jgi:hypothetical protein
MDQKQTKTEQTKTEIKSDKPVSFIKLDKETLKELIFRMENSRENIVEVKPAYYPWLN